MTPRRPGGSPPSRPAPTSPTTSGSRRTPRPRTHGRRSAVLMLFGPDPRGGEDVVLTERAHTLRSHPGQVSFPGGRVDPDDDGSVAAALREAEEEVGLDPAGVEVLATFPDVFLTPSQHAVTPVLAWWPSPGAGRGRRPRRGRAGAAGAGGRPPRPRRTGSPPVLRALPRAGVRGRRALRVGLHRDAAEQPVRARRAWRCPGTTPSSGRCPTACCRRGCGGRSE